MLGRYWAIPIGITLSGVLIFAFNNCSNVRLFKDRGAAELAPPGGAGTMKTEKCMKNSAGEYSEADISFSLFVSGYEPDSELHCMGTTVAESGSGQAHAMNERKNCINMSFRWMEQGQERVVTVSDPIWSDSTTTMTLKFYRLPLKYQYVVEFYTSTRDGRVSPVGSVRGIPSCDGVGEGAVSPAPSSSPSPSPSPDPSGPPNLGGGDCTPQATEPCDALCKDSGTGLTSFCQQGYRCFYYGKALRKCSIFGSWGACDASVSCTPNPSPFPNQCELDSSCN